MPEAAVGLFPDCGATYFLNALPPGYAYYLGLSGKHVIGEDLVRAKIATHYMTSDQVVEFRERLEKEENLSKGKNIVKIADDIANKPVGPYKNHDLILEIFASVDNFSDLWSTLNSIASSNPEAKLLLDQISRNSPLAVRVAFELLKRGQGLTLPECYQMEYRA